MDWRSLSASGLLIALIGFFLTRFTVSLAAGDSPLQFLFAGIVPLVLGLSLSAFGVILTVGRYDRALVRTTARWCLAGTGAMAVLAVLTLLGTQPDVLMNPEQLREQTALSNFLIGGAVGGTLTGLYAARNRTHRRDLRQQANRLTLLNRLLRDQVINAGTAIKGHAAILEDQHNEASVETIGEQAQSVIDTVEDVKYLSNTADKSDLALGAIDLQACLEDELDELREQYPEAVYEYTAGAEEIEVRANAQLREVFRHLLVNAVEYSDDTPQVGVRVETTRTEAVVQISDSGPGLPDSQQRLLERGEIAEFDDPTTGFGLNIVRLLIESFDGTIETDVNETGTTVSVTLPRAAPAVAPTGARPSALTTPGVAPSRIALAVGSAVVAAATMAISMEAVGGEIPVIGALYGIKNPIVAILTHGFHSIVFGLVYAGLLAADPVEDAKRAWDRVRIALGLGLILWLVAAGVIMPLWLQLVGVEASIPMLTVPSLMSHTVWAVTLGLLYHYGDLWLTRASAGEQLGLPRMLDRVS